MNGLFFISLQRHTVGVIFRIIFALSTLSLVALPAIADKSEQELKAALKTHRPMPKEWVASLSAQDVQFLLEIITDADKPVIQRWRALSLTSKHRNTAALAVWQKALKWPERSLRTQAAWALGLSAETELERINIARALLSDARPEMREIGAKLLFVQSSPQTLAIARELLVQRDADPKIREKIQAQLERIERE